MRQEEELRFLGLEARRLSWRWTAMTDIGLTSG